MEHALPLRKTPINHHLRRRCVWLIVSQWLALIGISAISFFLFTPASVLKGWLAAALVLGLVHRMLWKNLAYHISPDDTQNYHRLGTANQITLVRGWLIGLLAATAFLSADPGQARWLAWLPALLYVVICICDYCDGLVARLTRTESLLGARLDMALDALGLLVASTAAVALNRLPAVYLLAGLSYYLFQIGSKYRRQGGKRVRPLADRPFGRAIAGINMAFVGLALMPVFSFNFVHHAAVLLMLPLLLGFVWDWLVVTARLDNSRADRLESILKRYSDVAAIVMRLVLLIFGLPAMQTLFARWSADAITLIVLGCMIILGGLGRSAAIAAACLVGMIAQPNEPSALLMLVFDCTVVLIMTGTGRLSLWRPEEALFLKRFGAGGYG